MSKFGSHWRVVFIVTFAFLQISLGVTLLGERAVVVVQMLDARNELVLAIQSAFDMDAADLTRLGKSDNGDNLYLNKVLHKTFISVAEQGTRAGAATLASASGSAAPSARPRQIYLDRPFVYMLVNLETNTPLFIGTLMAVSE